MICYVGVSFKGFVSLFDRGNRESVSVIYHNLMKGDELVHTVVRTVVVVWEC